MAYDAAQRGAWDARWNPKDESPDAELVRDLPRLRERCIDLVRNDPLAYGVISTISHNVVGRGPRPRSLHPDANVQAALDALWWAWAPHAGWDGMSTWGDQMRGLVQAACMSGDVGVLWPDVGDGTGPRIDLVDARRIDTPKDKTPEVESCRLGVGYDKYGRTHGIYIASGETTGGNRDAFRWFPLDRDGRINCRLYRRPSVMRPRQSRAVPMFAPAAMDLKDLREYRRTELRRAQRAAKDVLVFTTPDPKAVADALENIKLDADASGDGDGAAEFLGRSYGTIPDGNTIVAAMGETVQTVTPPQVNGGTGDYMEAMLRAVATCTGLPFEEAFRLYAKLNYSNARTIRIMSKAVYRDWRDSLEDVVCIPTWELLVRYWWASGALGRTPWDPRLLAHEWHWDAMEWVDPGKEVSANADAMATGQRSIVEVCAETGRDWKQIADENLAAEVYMAQRRRELGLTAPAVAPATAPKNVPPEDDKNQKPDEEDDVNV
jgi:lambda family phage portal protein